MVFFQSKNGEKMERNDSYTIIIIIIIIIITYQWKYYWSLSESLLTLCWEFKKKWKTMEWNIVYFL